MKRLPYVLQHARLLATGRTCVMPQNDSIFWQCTMGGARYFCSASRTQQITQILMSHPSVAECAFFNDVAYIVRKTTPKSMQALDGGVEEWELKDYVMGNLGLAGFDYALPRLRLIDFLPEGFEKQVPFTSVHIIDALFEYADTAGNETLSFEEFASFCQKTKLFNDNEDEIRDIFFSLCKRPSTSQLLFAGDGDLFGWQEDVKMNIIDFYEFQKLIYDAGIVEVRSTSMNHSSTAASLTYFIDERIVDIVLSKWYSTYDKNDDGCLDIQEYARLVGDYHLHFAVSDGAFRRLTKDGNLSVDDFRTVLEQSGLLVTGASVEKADEVGKLWRDIEDSQQFLQPTSVFVADGRAGTSPVKQRGFLRFVCISDTHCRHRDLTAKLPAGDVLLHAGDFSMSGRMEEVIDFAEWIQSLQFERKIVIAGNHDVTFDRSYDGDHGSKDDNATAVRQVFANIIGSDGSVVYLEDEECCYKGVRIYGTPWQPEFGYWAFNLPRDDLLEKWRAVPAGIDILMVHGPPLGRGDVVVPAVKHVGCPHLLNEIQSRIRPAYTIFGHVHESAGVSFDGITHFLNASSLDEHYDGIHPPLVFDYPIAEDQLE